MSAVDRFNSVRAVRDYSNKQIRSVLDRDQAKKFDQLTHRARPDSLAPQETGNSD
jgi:hypothetical protein